MATERALRKQRKREERARRRASRRPSILVQEFWNLPNMLTLGRILLIPVFVWLTYDADPLHSLLAALVFAVAAITDVIDGYLARRWNLITVVGKFMDPLADKLIAMAALVMMVRLGRIAAWVVIVLLAREFIVTGLRTIAASEGMVIAAGQEGKWKTSLQLVGIISLCVHYVHPLDLGFRTVTVDYNQVGKVLVYLSGAFSVWSAVVYFRAFLGMLARRGGADPDAKSV
ncbi:CDP-diacylglycerol--glycerol-3-phosphate 3-phosphatidyltransferase [Corallococcus sp. AB049A]|jgi:CDP-diacylglycerol--glycerol-3-phosphate 3-phosphatidyltransferase|uniref:CDP-diacylglycerol--glycerol-3-phosphate 3-phosphatidyltransferase n=1 Tax=Corallococcus interemptor TaxID=2316720 RepID=A0A3A8Q4Q5_9BACT|nr:MULTISPECIES: CDP-diacylglycerol--glycerol-3-phosphate 3-phosphatidyltransferase [Corallococcus]RKH53423.1 CDP-diacylglycerol--glycerol-3-phosphate 3-phosphatidyltransferase [Corallococcus sp. AB050B]RKH63646.1 CDP-diacylglycerol--glycerol-3-phosphate 3-phosphatidyltransferase [Corallococcus interemptor]RKI67034.1 CDP-diacylglycerol--glycerol-3-phosphate 3-phosphatidyltransferase [Corallococcus sp. AB049A]